MLRWNIKHAYYIYIFRVIEHTMVIVLFLYSMQNLLGVGNLEKVTCQQIHGGSLMVETGDLALKNKPKNPKSSLIFLSILAYGIFVNHFWSLPFCFWFGVHPFPLPGEESSRLGESSRPLPSQRVFDRSHSLATVCETHGGCHSSTWMSRWKLGSMVSKWAIIDL